MVKKRVFISFDFDNDRALRDFIVGQAKNPDSPFEISDCSLKETAPEMDWLIRARMAIMRADIFVIMLGPRTRFASGVLKEVRYAHEYSKKIVQIIGYKDGTEEWSIPNAGRTYAWDWENLKNILA